MEINFNPTKEDHDVIIKIAKRASKELNSDTLDTMMDITAVHLNGNPLRLTDLLKANRLNFAHDIRGIANHLDRESGKLTRCFLPRFSKPETNKI